MTAIMEVVARIPRTDVVLYGMPKLKAGFTATWSPVSMHLLVRRKPASVFGGKKIPETATQNKKSYQ